MMRMNPMGTTSAKRNVAEGSRMASVPKKLKGIFGAIAEHLIECFEGPKPNHQDLSEIA